jgi:hypothetical protein
VRFKGGLTVKFVNPSFFNEDPINRSALLLRMDDFDVAFGAAIRESKYQQFKDVVSVKPADLSPLCGRREFARTPSAMKPFPRGLLRQFHAARR